MHEKLKFHMLAKNYLRLQFYFENKLEFISFVEKIETNCFEYGELIKAFYIEAPNMNRVIFSFHFKNKHKLTIHFSEINEKLTYAKPNDVSTSFSIQELIENKINPTNELTKDDISSLLTHIHNKLLMRSSN